MIDLEVNAEDPTIVEMCQRYWQLDDEGNFVGTVQQIADDHGLSQYELRETVKAHCTARSTDSACERCGSPFIYTSRTDYQSPSFRRRSPHRQLCQDCDAEVAEQRRLEQERARAKREAELRRQQEDQRVVILNTFSGVPEQPVDPRDLSLEDTVFLLSVVRFGATEDFGEIRPLESVEGALTPTANLTEAVVTHLYDRRLIDIHPGSDVAAFVFENERVRGYYHRLVSWRLFAGRNLDENLEIVSALENAFATQDWPDAWQDEWLPLWRKIALHECLEYLDVCMQDRGFDFNPGKKTMMVFNRLLDSYSVAQAYNMIWGAARSAADFYVRKNPPKQQAANSVIGGIQRRVERARDEGWNVKAYRRDFRCPRSMVSHVLFSTALQMGDEGFTQAPGPIRAGNEQEA
jgi:hypothetical protein